MFPDYVVAILQAMFPITAPVERLHTLHGQQCVPFLL